MGNKAEREQFWREMQQAREEHQEEVAFTLAHPIHTQPVGEMRAKQFIAHLTEVTEWMEKNWNRPGNEADPSPKWDEDTPKHYEVAAFFTPEQHAKVEALRQRGEQVEILGKAQSYDDLLQTLESIGLCPDLVFEPGDTKGVETLVIENYERAAEWFKNALITDEDHDQ